MVKLGYLLFAVLALSIEKGSSINCYSCISSSVLPNAGCATGSLAASNSVTCPAGQNFCTTSTLRTTVGFVTVTDTRACSATAVATGCITAIGTTTCTSTCNTDNCNSGTVAFSAAGAVGGNTITLTIMLLAQALFLFLLK